MKQLFVLINLLAAPIFLFAQPTLTLAELPTVGTTMVVMSDSNAAFGQYSITPAGPNQIWDYSSILNNVTDTVIYQFISPSNTDPAAQQSFPNATLAVYDAHDSVTSFYSVNSGGFYMDGVFMGSVNQLFSQPQLRFNPSYLIFPAGFGYGDSISSESGMNSSNISQGSTILLRQHYKRIIKADAWGSLTTPAGYFAKTLRLRILTSRVDSVFIMIGTQQVPLQTSTDTSIVYSWHQSGTRLPLLQLMEDPDSTGNTAAGGTVNYYEPRLLAAKSEISADQLVVSPFPNPAVSIVYFPVKNITAERLLISDVLGRTHNEQTVSGAQRLSWSIADQPSGNYYYRLLDKVGKVVQRGAFNVNK